MRAMPIAAWIAAAAVMAPVTVAANPVKSLYTTIELKANFLGTARDGVVACEANLIHGGRTTQVWDARVTSEQAGKTIALFRCTQMLLYPK